MLLASGNPNPPERLDGLADLRAQLGTKEFRGACWMRDIRIEPGRDSPTLKLRYGYGIGYTPFGGRYHPGAGSVTGPRLVDSGGLLTVELTVRFKLGRFFDFAQTALTSHRAPSAWMRMQYSLEGEAWSVSLCGSAIPSQWLYIDGHRECARELCEVHATEVDTFIAAGACKDAPEHLPEVRAAGLLENCQS